MVSTKYALFLGAAFVAGAFISSPELRAYAANTVFSTDIVDGEVKTADIANSAVTNSKLAGNAVSSSKINDGAVKTADIGDGEVRAADIATDAVGAAELQGVTKLMFFSCNLAITNFAAGSVGSNSCSVPGVQDGDNVMVTINAETTSDTRHCVVLTSSDSGADIITVRYRNTCSAAVTGSFSAEIIVFNT